HGEAEMQCCWRWMLRRLGSGSWCEVEKDHLRLVGSTLQKEIRKPFANKILERISRNYTGCLARPREDSRSGIYFMACELQPEERLSSWKLRIKLRCLVRQLTTTRDKRTRIGTPMPSARPISPTTRR